MTAGASGQGNGAEVKHEGGAGKTAGASGRRDGAGVKHEEHAGKRAKEEEVNIGKGLEEKDDQRVLFSSLIGRQRLSNEEITSCLTKGIKLDITASTSTPNFPLVADNINWAEEIKKSLECPYWPLDKEFLSNFNFEGIEEPYLTKLKNLLCLFKHCYWNEDRKVMFRKGVQNIPLLRIQKLPNVIPKKDKVRVTPDKK